MNLYKETLMWMEKYNIKAQKTLGQNFLIAENVVSDIVEKAGVGPNDLVIEIGPGLGTLTSELLKKAGKVIAIELDRKMIRILTERFRDYKNFEVIFQDVLKVNLKGIIEIEKQINPELKYVKVVANLPYYITTPIIMQLLETEPGLNSIIVMIQKEVADRLCALPGQRGAGAITYSIYYYAQTRKLLGVSNDSFYPQPDVASQVIRFDIRESPAVEVKSKEKLFEIIKYAFMQRRKTLLNGLQKCPLFKSKEQIMEIFKEVGIDEKVRGEAISLEKFAEISDKID